VPVATRLKFLYLIIFIIMYMYSRRGIILGDSPSGRLSFWAKKFVMKICARQTHILPGLGFIIIIIYFFLWRVYDRVSLLSEYNNICLPDCKFAPQLSQ